MMTQIIKQVPSNRPSKPWRLQDARLQGFASFASFCFWLPPQPVPCSANSEHFRVIQTLSDQEKNVKTLFCGSRFQGFASIGVHSRVASASLIRFVFIRVHSWLGYWRYVLPFRMSKYDQV
jgi:hypothetical protein